MRVSTANLDFVRGGDRLHLAHLCADADVLCVQEAKDVDLAAILPAGWAALQDFEGGPDRAGSAICYNTATIDMDDFTLTLGARPTSGVKMLTRWIAQADATEKATGRKARIFSAHAPKRDTGLQPLYYRRLRAATFEPTPLPVMVGGDFNRPHEAVATLLGMRSVGEGIIGVLADKRIRFGTVRVDTTGLRSGWTDHPAVAVSATVPKEPAVSRGIYPAAKQLPIPPGANDPPIVPRIAVLHVDAGNAESLHAFFRDRSGGVESHFHVRRDGVVEQYRNIFWQADANLDANDFAVSIETQGFGAGEWTPLQLAAIKRLLLWLNTEAGIPLIRCTAWNGKGVGYHTQFGAPGHWTPVAKSCPGPDRIKQYDAVIVPWMKTALEPADAPQPTPRWDALWESLNDAAHRANDLVGDLADDTRRDDAARDVRALARQARTLAAEFSTKH